MRTVSTTSPGLTTAILVSSRAWKSFVSRSAVFNRNAGILHNGNASWGTAPRTACNRSGREASSDTSFPILRMSFASSGARSMADNTLRHFRCLALSLSVERAVVSPPAPTATTQWNRVLGLDARLHRWRKLNGCEFDHSPFAACRVEAFVSRLYFLSLYRRASRPIRNARAA